MAEYPETVTELHDWFPDEAACRAYLEQVRWPEGPRCPRCPAAKVWRMTPPFYRCGTCGRDFTATAGTLFANTKLPLRLWFETVWYVVNQKNGVSALGIQRLLGLGSYPTAWRWLHKLRRAMVRPGRDRLSGTVEVDEVYVGGGRPAPPGRRALGNALVLVVAQTDGDQIGRIRLARISNASGSELVATVGRSVEPGTQVLTDRWEGYAGLEAHGYKRNIVRATATVGKNPLPCAKRVVAHLKRWLLGTHQGAVARSHLDYYLDEFTFRFNRRTSGSRGLLFYRLLQQAVAFGPVRCGDLAGGRQKGLRKVESRNSH